jgi:hypothetical protein
MIHEFKNTLWVMTPHGEGLALLLIDYGIQQNTVWVVANKSDGRIRHYDSNQIRLAKNHTIDLNI